MAGIGFSRKYCNHHQGNGAHRCGGYPDGGVSGGADYLVGYAGFAGNEWVMLLRAVTDRGSIVTFILKRSYVVQPDSRRILSLISAFLILWLWHHGGVLGRAQADSSIQRTLRPP